MRERIWVPKTTILSEKGLFQWVGMEDMVSKILKNKIEIPARKKPPLFHTLRGHGSRLMPYPYCAVRLCLLRLRRHKLPTPHLALWPTEVHVVMRGKVCEKGCYFLGTQTPLVATCKNKVCISNICHYLHFWKHTDFQNKDIQSPKYSVVLHLDHCIPVCGGGGGGAAYFSLPFVRG